jgi:hypothetical protein
MAAEVATLENPEEDEVARRARSPRLVLDI